MNSLAARIARLIELQGPMSLAEFMSIALHDSLAGYYATRAPIGAEGDFITAPEISQMFGELLGAWAVQAWRNQGSPSPAYLVELGPGRGTLMADVLRAAKLNPKFLKSIDVVLIETSPGLKEAQAETLKDASVAIRWQERFDDTLTDRSLFLLANEFFDALPIRQFVFTGRGWCERMVGVDRTGTLTLALSPALLPLDVPAERGLPKLGAVYEVCPQGDVLVEQIAGAIANRGGAALIVDYGFETKAGFGETMQAVAKHEYTSVLDNPGEADLSAHLDFGSLARTAEKAGAKAYGPIPQGEFLTALGIVQRAKILSRNHLADAAIPAQLDRLIAPEQMGTLFKAMAIVPHGAPRPPGF